MASVTLVLFLLLPFIPSVTAGSYCYSGGTYWYCYYGCCYSNYNSCCTSSSYVASVSINWGVVAGGIVGGLVFIAILSIIGALVKKKYTTTTRVGPATTTSTTVAMSGTSGVYPTHVVEY
ncbi:uncharacterized protein LOC143299797 [Babylonia areolata]|uniref:uncharacterized protein LOC143299797 n=1 Tax=Babylonia areolata TaxID=304850 RepID=UPI003FD6709D